MKKIIVAVYTGRDRLSSLAIAGVFIGSLETTPVYRVFLPVDKAEKEAEKQVAEKINLITKNLKGYTIDFFEGSKIVNKNGKRINFFNPPESLFSFQALLGLL